MTDEEIVQKVTDAVTGVIELYAPTYSASPDFGFDGRSVAFDLRNNIGPQIVRDVRRILDTAKLSSGAGGWIVGNSADNQWRSWNEFGPSWTGDPAEAIRYARREDAEAVHRDDEDAWSIVQYPTPPTEPAVLDGGIDGPYNEHIPAVADDPVERCAYDVLAAAENGRDVTPVIRRAFSASRTADAATIARLEATLVRAAERTTVAEARTIDLQATVERKDAALRSVKAWLLPIMPDLCGGRDTVAEIDAAIASPRE